MFFVVRHRLQFDYDEPVFCEPLTIRLRPREGTTQRLLRYQMRIKPEPAGRCCATDMDNNDTETIWFEGKTNHLILEASSLIETKRGNPFDFLLEHQALRLPHLAGDRGVRWGNNVLGKLYADPGEKVSALRTWALGLAEQSEGHTTTFLTNLTATLHEQWEYYHRPDGAAHTAEQTWNDRAGSCRDLAVLFNEACRAVGLPARFVSGYLAEPERVDDHELHAWSEVFLPGAGWRGFDPSTGLAVADLHVPVAAGREPAYCSPTSGTYRGQAPSTLTTHIDLHARFEVKHNAISPF